MTHFSQLAVSSIHHQLVDCIHRTQLCKTQFVQVSTAWTMTREEVVQSIVTMTGDKW